MKFIFYLVVTVVLLSVGNVQAQKEGDKSDVPDIKTLIESQRFLFDVESVSPMRGGYRRLSPGYTFTSTKDSLVSSLPYFGRAYQATMNPSDAGINFTSLKFEYTIKPRKKGGWDITLKPKDVTNFTLLNFSVSENGNASLRISPTDRESISYSGTIKPKP